MTRPRRRSRPPRAVVALLAASLTVTLAGGVAVAARSSLSSGPTPAGRAAAAVSRPAPSTEPLAAHSPLAAPTPTTAPAVHVPRPAHLVSPTLLLRSTHPFSAAQVGAVRRLAGVRRTELVDSGHVGIDGHGAWVLGVSPASFRAWTPQRSEHSNALWDAVAGGELTTSFDMGQGTKLPLGHQVPVGPRASATSVRVGAFASVGLGDTDAIVDRAVGREVGLTPSSALLVSAPAGDALVLDHAVSQALGSGVRVELLRDVVSTRDPGEFIGRASIGAYLDTALKQVGKPYVWGGDGPADFDCSGLVQWSFAHAGLTMPRVAAEQFLTGAHVRYADARPGDLLFWHYDPTDPTDVDHVAIYLGDGRMVVAPHTGEDVQVMAVPLDHLAGVVRVDPALAGAVAG